MCGERPLTNQPVTEGSRGPDRFTASPWLSRDQGLRVGLYRVRSDAASGRASNWSDKLEPVGSRNGGDECFGREIWLWASRFAEERKAEQLHGRVGHQTSGVRQVLLLGTRLQSISSAAGLRSVVPRHNRNHWLSCILYTQVYMYVGGMPSNFYVHSCALEVREHSAQLTAWVQECRGTTERRPAAKETFCSAI